MASLAACQNGTDEPGEDTVPALARLAPDTVFEASPTLRVFGTGFSRTSKVLLQDSVVTSTYVSARELRLDLPPSYFLFEGSIRVRVENPAPSGGSSGQLRGYIRLSPLPPPVLRSVTPATLTAGARNVTATLRGSGFAGRSRVVVVAPPGSFLRDPTITSRTVSSSEIVATLPDSLLVSSRTLELRVINDSFEGGGGSAAVPLSVRNEVPAITALSATEVAAGASNVPLRVSGQRFTSNSVVEVGGTALRTTFVDSATLAVMLRDSTLREAGPVEVRVVNPPPGGGPSNSLMLQRRAVPPVLNVLPVAGANATGVGFDLLLHGSNFLEASIVRVNGTARTSRYVSGSRVIVTLTGGDLAVPQVQAISVETVGGTSATRTLTVHPVGASTLTAMQRLSLPAGAAALLGDPVRNRVYALRGSAPFGGPPQPALLVINALTGAITDSVRLSGTSFTTAAIADDASVIYLARVQDGTVLRIDPATLAVTGTWTLPGGLGASGLQVLPGQARTLAVALQSSTEFQGMGILDDGVLRPIRTTRAQGAMRFFAVGIADTLYALQRAPGAWRTPRLHISADGVRGDSLEPDFTTPFTNASAFGIGGRLLTADGDMVDAGSGRYLGSIPRAPVRPLPLPFDVSTYLVVPEIARAIVRRAEGLLVYDLHTLRLLGTIALPADAGGGMSAIVRCASDGVALLDVWGVVTIVRSPLLAP